MQPCEDDSVWRWLCVKTTFDEAANKTKEERAAVNKTKEEWAAVNKTKEERAAAKKTKEHVWIHSRSEHETLHTSQL